MRGRRAGALVGLPRLRGAEVERWFAAQGAPPRLDLARSGAAPLSVRDVLALSPADGIDALLDTSLDYGDGRGDERLRAAIAAAGFAPSAGSVLVTHGAAEALLLACAVAARGDPGGRALVASPAHGTLFGAARAAGLRACRVPVCTDGRGLDLEALSTRVAAGVRVVVVNSPHNPSGGTACPEGLDALARRCAALGARLVVDEVALATSAPEARSATSCAAFAEGLMVVCGDVSKSMGLGGLRIGWMTSADAGLLGRAAALKDLTTVANARPTELLAAIALENRAVLGRRTAAWAAENLRAVDRLVGRVRGAWTPPNDGLVAFPRLPLPAPAEAFAVRLREASDVAVVPGSLFDAPDRLRLGIGCRPEEFAEGVERLEEAMLSA